MWKIATIIFVIAVMATPIFIEITRSIVHRQRIKINPTSSIQDIAMYGTFLGIIFIVGAIVSAVLRQIHLS